MFPRLTTVLYCLLTASCACQPPPPSLPVPHHQQQQQPSQVKSPHFASYTFLEFLIQSCVLCVFSCLYYYLHYYYFVPSALYQVIGTESLEPGSIDIILPSLLDIDVSFHAFMGTSRGPRVVDFNVWRTFSYPRNGPCPISSFPQPVSGSL